jgi:ketosteroid isomerase-like protein
MTEDRGAIQRLAERLIAAEIACDLSVFEAAITDDMVIMPPAVPAIVGRTDCLAFIRTVLEENAAELERNIIEYSSGEIASTGIPASIEASSHRYSRRAAVRARSALKVSTCGSTSKAATANGGWRA